VDVSQNSALEYSVADLAKVYNKTLLVADILKNKNFSWITQSHFTPCQEYIKIMNDLGASGTIGSNCLKELIKTGELEFQKFKARLLEYKTELNGTFLSSDVQTTSAGFNNFQNEIKSILDQPFVCVTPKGKLSTVILEDKMLIWDLKRLKELSVLIDKYYDFSENMPNEMRAQFFDMYKTVARKCFYPIISSMLGSAQILDDMPVGHSNSLLEDAYKRQAANIRGASFALPKIVKIIDEMEDEDNAKDCGFSSMIIAQYSSLLEKIDALFDQEKPYSAEHAAFDHWNGDTKAMYLNMNSQEELKQYLTAQFARIRFLAKDLASPIVDLLSMPHFVEKIKNQNLIEKWKGIIASIDDYESKKPGNSIAALESFLADSLARVSVGSLDEQGEIKTISETAGDYFLSKRSDVAKSLLSRADVVKYDKAANAYTKIQKFFNDNLAHKFPFGESKTDASLKDVENFINLYEQNSSNIRDVLSKNQKVKNVNEKALEFLELTSAKLIPFLKTWIAHSKTSDAGSALVTFNVQVRPSPELEAFTSSVMDRELKINNAQVNDNDNGLFFSGNKVDLLFNWVSSADEKPNEQGATGNMLIQGSTVTFSYDGKWAMFRLIEENKTNKETESPNGVLLQFNVPIVDGSQGNSELTAKMVLKITPMAKDGDKTAPMVWPIFPEFCPGLHGEEEVAESINGEQTHD
jgi:type VI secretion system protein ImpL